jgi:2-oxoglutarate ferredoxin oxidoreductase subunit beta
VSGKRITGRPKSLTSAVTHYCPGCGHGVIHRIIAEAVDELGLAERVIGTAPVGCSVLSYDYFDWDMLECPHGRAPAAATGIKRVHPDAIVYTYQGDGDLAAIGTAEIVHAANRGEKITVFFVNNAIYGMTGGQMAPTTLPGQVTKTTPKGRRPDLSEGFPIPVCELLSVLGGTYYAVRVAITGPKEIAAAKKAVLTALRYQMEGKGLTLVEFLSACPTNWKMTPEKAVDWVEKEMVPVFPLGVVKDKGAS